MATAHTRPAAPVVAETRTAGHLRSPKVTVVISTYGHERWLRGAVDAVLDQDLADELQLVVCDDASPDATRAVMHSILERIEDETYPGARSVTYIRLGENGG